MGTGCEGGAVVNPAGRELTVRKMEDAKGAIPPRWERARRATNDGGRSL